MMGRPPRRRNKVSAPEPVVVLPDANVGLLALSQKVRVYADWLKERLPGIKFYFDISVIGKERYLLLESPFTEERLHLKFADLLDDEGKTPLEIPYAIKTFYERHCDAQNSK